MGSFQDAMKKAGIASDAVELPAAAPETPAANGEARADSGERKPRGERPPRNDKPAEKVEDKPCAKCGTVFSPKHAKHRLCPKCAEEHFTAPKEKTERPAGAAGDAPAAAEGAAAKPPAPKRDRPPRPPRPASEVREARQERPRDAHREGHRDQPRDQPRDSHRDSREAPAGFPSDYLRSGYFAGAALRDEVLDSWARNVAALLVSRGLAAVQLRAFYTHVQRAETSAKAGRDFKLVREDLLKMRPVAAARQGRRLIPGEFADFLDRNLELVKDAASLRAFGEHFQAVVGYTAGRLRK
jgi:CRISPR type III-A-associated protein Csm2